MELDQQTIDKQAVGRRFGASAASYDRYALAQQHIYQELERRLGRIGRRDFGRVLEVGCGTGGFSKYIDERYEIQQWTLNDLGDEMLRCGGFVPRSGHKPELLLGDAEAIELGSGYDLILSSSAIQWFDAPANFIASLRERLAPGGILLLSSFGPKNLTEIRQLTNRGLNYATCTELEQYLSGYEYYEVSEEVYPLRFTSAREVLLHLKHTGVTAVGASEGFWSVERLRTFEHQYQELFAEPDGMVRLSYHPIYILAW